MHLTNITYIRGVFDSLIWSTNRSDSVWHFEGPKWGLTQQLCYIAQHFAYEIWWMRLVKYLAHASPSFFVWKWDKMKIKYIKEIIQIYYPKK